MSRTCLFIASAALLPCVLEAGTIFVDWSYTGTLQNGTQQNPYTTVSRGVAAASAGDVVSINSGGYHEAPLTITKNLTLQAGGGPVTIDQHAWGHLANPGFVNKPIKATLFFAGQP